MRLTILFVFAAVVQAQSIRVVRFSESKPFQMGEVISRRIVHPDLGAKKTTLNYSVSKPGSEFAQHVHDYSDDTILVLEGEVDLRQGDSRRRFKAGECAFVPTGQIHGTITAGTGEATMISFQNPPDLILYTGARDSKRPGLRSPKVRSLRARGDVSELGDKNGFFTSAAMGSKRAAGARRVLKPNESFKTHVDVDGEAVAVRVAGRNQGEGQVGQLRGGREGHGVRPRSGQLRGDRGRGQRADSGAGAGGGAVTRRTFSSAVVGAAALSAADDRIRVAMIGTGHGHALSKIKALRSMPEYELVGIHRPDSSDEPAEGEPLRGVKWLTMDEILGTRPSGWWRSNPRMWI